MIAERLRRQTREHEPLDVDDAAQIPRPHPVRPAKEERARPSCGRRPRGAVERRLSAAHHQHALVLHQVGIGEDRRVHDATGEALHTVDGGNARRREDAVADDHEVEIEDLLASGGAHRHAPACAALRHLHHLGADSDAGEETEPLCIGLQVGAHLRRRGEVGDGRWERVIGEGVGVPRIVRAQSRVRARRSPHAPERRLLLEHHDVEAVAAEHFGRNQPGYSGPDHAHARRGAWHGCRRCGRHTGSTRAVAERFKR